MPYITIRYEREKLYDEVWAEPVSTVAKRYGGESRLRGPSYQSWRAWRNDKHGTS